MDRPELVRERDGWEELFSFRATCEDDRGQYPGKDEILAHFLDRCDAAGQVLDAVDDELFRRPLPEDHPMRSRMSDVGSLVNFLLVAHPMVHLGQISAWRRAAGMGSAL
jgi:hypothetical protein